LKLLQALRCLRLKNLSSTECYAYFTNFNTVITSNYLLDI